MHYLLLVHLTLLVWVAIDGFDRRMNIVPCIMGTMILGPVILPYYICRRPLKAGEFPKDKRLQSLLKCLAIFWAFMWAVIGIWGGKIYTDTTRNEPLEYRLAVISNKGRVLENDEIMIRFRYLIDRLSESYFEDPQQIVNISVILYKKIKENGIDESLLNIMEGMNQIIWPEDGKKRSYSEYAFAYVALRNRGLPHNEAIDNLQAIVNGY